MQAYLFVHFHHPEHTAEAEQVYFAVSRNGKDWKALNGEKPVLTSTMGETGVRDPFIVFSPEHNRYYLIATDLSIFHHGDWTRAQTAGSQSIMVWESEDLVQWSEQRMVRVAMPDAGCTWAPECIRNNRDGGFLVYWASKTSSDQFRKQRIYCADTTDFRSFSAPRLYIEKASDIIDTTIVAHEGFYYRFSKDETVKSIVMEKGDDLTGTFSEVESFSLKDVQGYEGPICYQIHETGEWCLLLDAYATGQGYQMFTAQDLATGRFVKAEGAMTTPYKFRHGTVISISEETCQRLEEAWTGKEVNR